MGRAQVYWPNFKQETGFSRNFRFPSSLSEDYRMKTISHISLTIKTSGTSISSDLVSGGIGANYLELKFDTKSSLEDIEFTIDIFTARE